MVALRVLKRCTKPYISVFRTSIKLERIHTASVKQVEASWMTLRRFSNTSYSSLRYEYAYM